MVRSQDRRDLDASQCMKFVGARHASPLQAACGREGRIEMTPATLAIIGATIVFSSFLSGVFGMAGGMILLGVLLNYFDVATAMILFSIIQLFANGWRALQWRSYVLWPIFGWYVLGAVISFAGMWTIAFVPDKAMVFLM